MITARRIQRLRERLAADNLPAILVSHTEDLPSANVRYLSGFTGSRAYLLITESVARLFADFRYIEQAAQQAPGFEIIRIQDKLVPVLIEHVRQLGLKQLAFEADHTTVATHHELSEALKEAGVELELKPVRGWVEDLRAAKEPAEIEALRKAVLLADRAFEAVAATLRPGVTEREVACAWKWRCARAAPMPLHLTLSSPPVPTARCRTTGRGTDRWPPGNRW